MGVDSNVPLVDRICSEGTNGSNLSTIIFTQGIKTKACIISVVLTSQQYETDHLGAINIPLRMCCASRINGGCRGLAGISNMPSIHQHLDRVRRYYPAG